jgi:hypothetical protein
MVALKIYNTVCRKVCDGNHIFLPLAKNIFGIMAKKTVQNSLLVLLTFLFMYGFLDILFRILGIGGGVSMRPDPILGTALIPGAQYQQNIEGFSKGKINSLGLRDYEYSYTKPDNTYRIVILGDSFTEAAQVALDSAYHKILERALNRKNGKKRYEIIAMGKSGMGTLEELLWYRTEGRKYHPDLVMCAFYIGNDFRDNSRELSQRKGASVMKPFLTDDGIVDTLFVNSPGFHFRAAVTPLMRYSRVLTFVMRTIEKIKKGNRSKGSLMEFPEDLNVYRTSYDPAWTRAVKTTARLLSCFCNEVKKDSAQFVVVGIPDSYQFYKNLPHVQFSSMPTDLDFGKPDSLLTAFARFSGFRYAALSPCFQSALEKSGLFYYGFGAQRGEGHWNEHGHALAAGCIEDALAGVIP